MLAGVCGGLADRLAIDPSLVRIGWVVLAVLTGGLFILLYIVMAIVVPEEPAEGWSPAPPSPGPGAVPGWNPPAAAAPAATGAVTTAPSEGSTTDPGTGDPTAAPPPPVAAAAPGAWQQPAAGAQSRAERRAARRAERERRGGGAALVIGLGLILIGGWLFLRPYIPDFGFEAFWPLVVVLVGVALVVAAFRRGDQTRP